MAAKLPSWFERAWRVPATAFAFAAFGLGGLLLRLIFFPALNLLQRDHAKRVLWARRAIQTSFASFVLLMRGLGLIRVEVRGRERLARQGLLVLANHPTLIDVVILISLLRNADCVVRGGLANNPFTRGPVRAAGYICNSEDGAALLQSCMDSMLAGGNLVIFPEGTRSRPGEPLKLQRGAAQIALRAERAITPVRISCEPLGLSKGVAWWRAADRPLHFVFTVDEDLAAAPFLESAAGEPGLAARRLTAYLTEYFSKEWPGTCKN
ncbi:1-acyl-sn-glycerol-3-phosphate acyltransferase [Paucibacter sp. KBW04]|uniref:lysophospholipid acyltransferase family protein n=1 Tax=Paucibacter sp. KBW04 TaxID=2153361 RepID=UPI000F588FF3|nr:lysophospholipid acyltransferase family protein [Paucibacter sp. KBW04]RQO55875.1 1-acyl-sn-glycerol-3-phosphate acyltransferase [Paucibacter sp. KBW04]